MMRFVWLTVFSLSAAKGSLALTITVDDIQLAPNTSGQVVVLSVSGGEAIGGVDFFAQVGDGGPEAVDLGHPAGADAPGIANVDLTSGIFAGNNFGQGDLLVPGSVPQLIAFGVITNTGTVNATGTLAALEFDTTGFSADQAFEFRIDNTLEGSTTIYDDIGGELPLTINYTSGDHSLITIVPEPVGWILLETGLTIFCFVLAAVRIRRKGTAGLRNQPRRFD